MRTPMAIAAAVLSLIAAPLSAGEVIPERRATITQNTDFPGGDLQPVFETTFERCESICLADAACMAFTFNFKANACFPKTGMTEMTPFDGAASAQILAADRRVLAREDERIAALAGIPRDYIDGAAAQARDLARNYATNQWTEDALIRAARDEVGSGNTERGFSLYGAALTLGDRADLWTEFSRLALVLAGDSARNDNRHFRREAAAAAINAYLRASSRGGQVTSLALLAEAAEALGDGRTSIPVLRLAQAIAPRRETEAALDRAIGLYGFRIAEHEVENNAALPRVCVTFTEDLRESGVDYADYLRTDAGGIAVTHDGRDLCIEGLGHGERHSIAFRAGLPAASGEELAKTVELEVYIRDRDPVAWFPGRAYILPRSADAALPIVTINMTSVDLALYRVDERNTVDVVRRGMIGAALNVWEEDDLGETLGAAIWTGSGTVREELNKEVTTRLPVGEVIGTLDPGIYALRARVPGADPYDNAAATQWFAISDLGLATMAGEDGLHAFIRGLGDAAPRAGVTVSLIAANNAVLGSAVTDAAGYARLDPGLMRGKAGAAPALVTAALGEDFVFLSLREAAFDLSDRGVSGRPAPPPVDVFLTTERGAYRPGETIHATALVRDGRVAAISHLPLTGIVTRPDGVEFGRFAAPDAGAGGHVLAVGLPGAAQRGTWKLALHADVAAPALASAEFLVEDFVPERIDFDLSLGADNLNVAELPDLRVDARYLYGAPGAGLVMEGELRFVPRRTHDAYRGYLFGREAAGLRPLLDFTGGETDADGTGLLPLGPPEFDDLDRPLELVADIRLREGSGRPVERQLRATMAPDVPLIGIRPQFDGDLPEGAMATFDVIALDRGMAPTGAAVEWTLDRLETRYQWYLSFGSWNWEAVTTRSRIAAGKDVIGTGTPLAVEARVDWGRYELRVERSDGERAGASYRFGAGWYAAPDAATTPDTLEMSLDRETYQPGDTARLRIVPRYAGKALVAVVSSRLVTMKAVEMTEGENIVTLDVTEDWGGGAYVTASVIRPMDAPAGRNPARALGLNWAGVDPGDRRLVARFVNGDAAAPRAPLDAVLEVEGAGNHGPVFATIAAVDVGILNLTGFDAPDPDGHYFGQRRLGLGLRDVYGRLIDGLNGEFGALKSGGDGPQKGSFKSPPPTEEQVAYFTGPVEVGPDGRATATFDLPAFNGTVRLMAVVWSERGVGQASQDVLVRDPVVVTASLPRFLAPHDESRMLLEIAHAQGPAGPVGFEIETEGGLIARTRAIPATADLKAGGRLRYEVPLIAPVAGDTAVVVRVTTPGGEMLEKRLALGVRSLDPEISRTTRLSLDPGRTFSFDENVFAGFIPGSGHATLSAGPLARFDAPGLLAALDRYPYGCTEQVTSRAMPLIYFGAVADAMGLGTAKDVDTRIAQAITEVLANQSSSGSFGLWRPDSGDLWLDAYVTDFLSRARAAGHAVPDRAFSQAIDNLRNRVAYAPDFENAGEDIAYALFVLAREGAAAMGDLRYFADARAEQFATPLAVAQIGAALAAYGDQLRADAMFRRAGQMVDARFGSAEAQLWRADYGTNYRDAAGVLTLAAEAGSSAVDIEQLAARIAPGTAAAAGLSTQENLWTLLASNALLGHGGEGRLSVDGAPVTGPLVRVFDAETAMGRALAIRNEGTRPATLVVSAFGIPLDPPVADGNGYSITRQYFDFEGQEVAPAEVALNTRLVTVLTVKPLRKIDGRLMVNDPLPAGFEIDNPNLIRGGDIRALDWLKIDADLAQSTEFRAERFLAAVDWRSEAAFRLAYVVRAVTPGAFHHPAATVEDMYRPANRAHTAAGRVVIVP